jgi:Domain of unknown function (DUF4399)
MKTQSVRALAAAAGALALLTGCGKPAAPPPAEAPPPPPAAVETPPAPPAMPRMAAPPGAKVTITSPANGAVVKSPVTLTFEIAGMTLAPAGTNESNTGHHHILIDTDIPALDQPIPKDDKHVHFGQAQTEATLELSPGMHTLQLLLGDGNHVPHDPPVSSEQISITVE